MRRQEEREIHIMKNIDSVQNPRVKQWKKLQTKKERDKKGLFFVEGFHLVEEALKAGVATELIVSDQTDLPKDWTVAEVEMYIVSEAVVKMLCETETTQGVFAVCEKHEKEIALTNGKFLLLDGLQDPGNLGTIIRTADAAGLDAVILGEGCVDVYNSKVLRSTQGSVFHLPIVKGNLEEWVDKLTEKNVPVYGTALENGVPYSEVAPSGSFALIVGNEGNGVRQELLAKCNQNLYIPIYGGAESLNVAVAAGILTYYLQTPVANR
ncbi:TrmH family RNA methyltransferase [Bacillus sp. BP-3]|uniref:TrmH family RNA methyltransferase n=1 Tax=Bacillus sp. BP-3 TaxID=3022773 RepID=UPI00232D8DBE|nr:RNA methyltransferase [Bacillus sp. BP-3]MDC2863098.1 RNA methyltransferase [Bacillus sp. BP-3]